MINANPGEEGRGGAEETLRREAAKKLLFMRILDEGARRRMNNIRFANPEFGAQLEEIVMGIVSSGRAKVIDEQTLIAIINRVRGEKRETRIIRK